MATTYRLQKEQTFPTDIETIWEFICTPRNLAKITPAYLGFEITSSNLPKEIYPGLIISYKVSPLLGIRINWVTEITHVRELEYFVDEQRVGPYAMWHHEHHLEEVPDGVRMTDIVTYRPPLGIAGVLLNAVVIRKKLEGIFDYREAVLREEFRG